MNRRSFVTRCLAGAVLGLARCLPMPGLPARVEVPEIVREDACDGCLSSKDVREVMVFVHDIYGRTCDIRMCPHCTVVMGDVMVQQSPGDAVRLDVLFPGIGRRMAAKASPAAWAEAGIELAPEYQVMLTVH